MWHTQAPDHSQALVRLVRSAQVRARQALDPDAGTCPQVGLQLVGLALVAFSTTLPEASGAACLALVAWQLLPARRWGPGLSQAMPRMMLRERLCCFCACCWARTVRGSTAWRGDPAAFQLTVGRGHSAVSVWQACQRPPVSDRATADGMGTASLAPAAHG